MQSSNPAKNFLPGLIQRIEANSPKLTALNLEGLNLEDADFELTCEALKKNDYIKEINTIDFSQIDEDSLNRFGHLKCVALLKDAQTNMEEVLRPLYPDGIIIIAIRNPQELLEANILNDVSQSFNRSQSIAELAGYVRALPEEGVLGELKNTIESEIEEFQPPKVTQQARP